MGKELFNFKPHEVSLVRKGANKKKAYVVKSGETLLSSLAQFVEDIDKEDLKNKLLPVVKDMMGMPSAAEGDSTEVPETQDMEGQEEVISCLQCIMVLMDTIRSKLPAGVNIGAYTEGASVSIYKSNETVVVSKQEFTDKEQALEDLNNLHVKEIEEIHKSYKEKGANMPTDNQDAIVTTSDTISDPVVISKEQELINKQAEEMLVLKNEIAALKEDKDLKEMITKCEKEFSNISQPNELGKLLHSIHKSSGKDVAVKLEEIFKSLDAQIKESGIFKEQGTSVPATGSADEKVQALVQKELESNPSLHPAEARAKVYEKHPELTIQKQ